MASHYTCLTRLIEALPPVSIVVMSAPRTRGLAGSTRPTASPPTARSNAQPRHPRAASFASGALLFGAFDLGGAAAGSRIGLLNLWLNVLVALVVAGAGCQAPLRTLAHNNEPETAALPVAGLVSRAPWSTLRQRLAESGAAARAVEKPMG
jgi:hypothetical protein